MKINNGITHKKKKKTMMTVVYSMTTVLMVSQDVGLRALHHSNDGEQYFALSNPSNLESSQSWTKDATIFEHQQQRFLIIRLLLPK